MAQHLYRISELARKASVSMRTLRYYDKEGVLSPSQRSDAGYRLYSDEDLAKLQHIIALKFLGFGLEEIRACLRNGSVQLLEQLAQQKAMMLEKRAHLDAVIAAITRTERLLQTGASDSELIASVMEVMQMELKPEWVARYMTPDQREQMRSLARMSYTPQTLQKLADRGWTEQDHLQHMQRYGAFRADLKRLAEAKADPAGPEAQDVARQLAEIIQGYSQGDRQVVEGMRRSWEIHSALPAAQQMRQYTLTEAEREFIKAAMAVRRQSIAGGQ